ncbi:hypothetical protein [Anaeromassilibacillus senegalensis]|uniref:hypothetical protein n=1 Tax=Anaeromassilibacillus senegalensis TaxID=1673717 RepID=UPI0012B5602F|nr:hypothetical protein [Anaeromassilibacillus senegalensis]
MRLPPFSILYLLMQALKFIVRKPVYFVFFQHITEAPATFTFPPANATAPSAAGETEKHWDTGNLLLFYKFLFYQLTF